MDIVSLRLSTDQPIRNSVLLRNTVNLSFLKPEADISDEFVYRIARSFKSCTVQESEQIRQELHEYKWSRAVALYKDRHYNQK